MVIPSSKNPIIYPTMVHQSLVSQIHIQALIHSIPSWSNSTLVTISKTRLCINRDAYAGLFLGMLYSRFDIYLYICLCDYGRFLLGSSSKRYFRLGYVDYVCGATWSRVLFFLFDGLDDLGAI